MSYPYYAPFSNMPMTGADQPHFAIPQPPQQQLLMHPIFTAYQNPTEEFVNNFYSPTESKQRRKITRTQLKLLEKTFEETAKPSLIIRKQLAVKLNMTPRSVQIWFQNKRAKVKSQGLNTNAIANKSKDENSEKEDENCETRDSNITIITSDIESKDQPQVGSTPELKKASLSPKGNKHFIAKPTPEPTKRMTRPQIEPIRIPTNQEQFQAMIKQQLVKQMSPSAWANQEYLSTLSDLNSCQTYDPNSASTLTPSWSLDTAMSFNSAPNSATLPKGYPLNYGLSYFNNTAPNSATFQPDTEAIGGFDVGDYNENVSNGGGLDSESMSRRNSCPAELIHKLGKLGIPCDSTNTHSGLDPIQEDETIVSPQHNNNVIHINETPSLYHSPNAATFSNIYHNAGLSVVRRNTLSSIPTEEHPVYQQYLPPYPNLRGHSFDSSILYPHNQLPNHNQGLQHSYFDPQMLHSPVSASFSPAASQNMDPNYYYHMQ